MGKKFTFEEAQQKLIGVGQKLKLIEYNDCHQKARVQCLICGTIFEVSAFKNLTRIIKKTGSFHTTCSCQSNRSKTSMQWFINKMKINSPNTLIIPGQKWQGTKAKYKYKCLICGYEGYNTGANLLRRYSSCLGCLRKTQQAHEAECKQLGYKVIGNYINSITPIEYECIDCGAHFMAVPSNLIRMEVKCPKCKRKKSKYELIVESILKENNISYEIQYRKNINNHYQYFDFYIKDLDLFIEVDGEGHYYPVRFSGISNEEAIQRFQIRRIKDAEKEMFCHWEKHNLLRIPYWLNKLEITNLLKQYFDAAVI